MITSKQWLETILADTNKCHHWLTRQYIGETQAAMRINDLANRIDISARAQKLMQ